MADRVAVKIKVIDGGKRPVEGALVAIEQGSAPYPEIAYVSDAAGTVTFHLPDGEFRVGARTSTGGQGTSGACVRNGAAKTITIVVSGPERSP